jgi:hypothetical protein
MEAYDRKIYLIMTSPIGSDVKPIKTLTIIAILAVALIAGMCVWGLHVPYNSTKRSGWYFADIKSNEVRASRTIDLMVARARLDQMLFPVPGTARILGPVAVTESEGSDVIYIVFFESLEGHEFLIYCGSKTTHRLMWKALDSNPA